VGNRTQARNPLRRVMVQSSCTCEWSGFFWHDDLLRLESDGLDGICNLMAAWALEDDGTRQRTIGSSEFGEFVAEHDWSDPGRMYRLARNLGQIFDGYRSRGARTRTAFDNEVAIVRCKAATLRAHGDSASADDLDEGIGEIVAWIEGRQPRLS
jgi:hypothetical protein